MNILIKNLTKKQTIKSVNTHLDHQTRKSVYDQGYERIFGKRNMLANRPKDCSAGCQSCCCRREKGE